MNLEEGLQRSRNNESIDFLKFESLNKQDPLQKIVSSDKIVVAPIWTVPGDFEGEMYAEYISKHPEYDGVYVRSELLQRLEMAAKSLPDPYKLVVRAGHRPIAVQKQLLKECVADYKKENPGISDEEALEHARDFVSDPEIELPPHVCGAAVDVEIIDASTGKYLDFGTAIGDDNEKSFLYYSGLTDEQKNNRLVLTKAMIGAGFASCMTEWWHFYYGDQLWAWFYDERNSLYNPIDI